CAATLLLLHRQRTRRGQRPRVRTGVPPLRAGVRRWEDGMTALVSSQAPGHWLAAWDEDLYERLCNSGGPMSRRRTERLSATVLGRDDGAIRCPRVLRVGL